MSNHNTSTDPKVIAIIAHIPVIGWFIALIMNNQHRSQLASFYVRQTVGLFVTSLLLYFVPFIGNIVFITINLLLIYSFVHALNGKQEPIPFIGDLYQDIFKGL